MILTQRLDHLGVVIVIWRLAISFTYFGFYCDRQLQAHYIGVVTVDGKQNMWNRAIKNENPGLLREAPEPH